MLITFLAMQKVFPEAVSAGNADANSGLPSDDSEDDDYDPDRTEVDKGDEGDESSSDGSENGSTESDKLKPSLKNDPYFGLPSEDSEDDDYDPDAPNKEKIDNESSSSDFTSDSEDLTAALGDKSIQNDGCPVSSSKDDADTAKCGRLKKQTLSDELQSLIESDPLKDASTPTAAKRHVERLDYKKLHDVSLLSWCYIYIRNVRNSVCSYRFSNEFFCGTYLEKISLMLFSLFYCLRPNVQNVDL